MLDLPPSQGVSALVPAERHAAGEFQLEADRLDHDLGVVQNDDVLVGARVVVHPDVGQRDFVVREPLFQRLSAGDVDVTAGHHGGEDVLPRQDGVVGVGLHAVVLEVLLGEDVDRRVELRPRIAELELASAVLVADGDGDLVMAGVGDGPVVPGFLEAGVVVQFVGGELRDDNGQAVPVLRCGKSPVGPSHQMGCEIPLAMRPADGALAEEPALDVRCNHQASRQRSCLVGTQRTIGRFGHTTPPRRVFCRNGTIVQTSPRLEYYITL